jgi:uncharacterized protein YbjQ (UPF0145 family)
MKKSLVLFLVAAAVAGSAAARNTQLMLAYADAIDSPEGQSQIDKGVKLMFGDKSMPAGAENKGEQIVNKIAKGDSRNDDMNACRRAVVQALAELQQRAKSQGADAVVNIVSYWKNNTYSSATQYECHAGGTGGHLTLKGTLVKLK